VPPQPEPNQRRYAIPAALAASFNSAPHPTPYSRPLVEERGKENAKWIEERGKARAKAIEEPAKFHPRR